MRIGIDLYSFIPDRNFGVGPTVYAYNLVHSIVREYKNHEFVLFTHSANDQLFKRLPNCKTIKSNLPPSKGLLRIVHEQLVLPFYFFKEKLDVLHFTGNVISLLICRRSVLTVHDLMWKYYLKSDWMPCYKKMYFSIMCPLSFKLAAALITDSAFIKNEILSFTKNIRSEKIHVIYAAQGLNEARPNEDEFEKLKRSYPPGFLFSVTTTWPHKNLITLIKAFHSLKEKRGFDKQLIVVGQNHIANREINKYIEENNLAKMGVCLLGFRPDNELKYFYQNAGVFVFPSFYEGFGFPILEAMRCGIPVVASRAASLPELGGDACLYADPRSFEDFADKINQLLSDPNLTQEVAKRAKLQESRFTWMDLTKKSVDVYRKVAGILP